MNKTMKIIDLLNKIANGEEVPEKIKYANYIFILKKDEYNDIAYYEEMEGRRLFLAILNSTVALNEEVEILEDEETIDIDDIEELGKILFIGDNKETWKKAFNDIIDNQNQMLRYLKQINKLEER